MKEYLNYCAKHQITFSQFVILYCVANDMIADLKSYVNENGDSALISKDEALDLVRKKLLKYDGDVEKEDLLFSKSYVNKSKFPFYSTDVDEWIEDWYELFPKGIKSGGYLVRTDMKSCKKKMQEFMKEYPSYDKDVIMLATKQYIVEMSEKNYSYMKLAPFFIKKEGVSMLQGYCENVLNNSNAAHLGDDPFIIKV